MLDGNIRIKGYLLLAIILLILANSVPGLTKELFVSPSGSDATTYQNNDIEHPWRTPEKAWREARAGDTVYFRSGTYAINSQIWTKYYGYDGSETSPIIFTNYENETVVFDGNGLNPVFRIEKNWNVIRGITCIRGGTFFMFAYDTSVTGGIVEDCTAYDFSGGDNVGFVYVNGASNITIKNCKIKGPGPGVHLNTSGIIIFNAAALKIFNCEISNVPIGIYYKHGTRPTEDTGIEIAYNYIHDTWRYSMELNCNYAKVHDNILGVNNANFRINESNGGPGGDHNYIFHNTFFSGSLILSSDDDGALYNIIRDNIFTSPCLIHQYSDKPHFTTMNYNLYPVGEAVIENRIHYDLSGWRNRNGGDLNSIAAVPVFVGGDHPNSIGDFALDTNSAGKAQASDGKDIGADTSLVGVSVKGLRPEPPQGLHRVQ